MVSITPRPGWLSEAAGTVGKTSITPRTGWLGEAATAVGKQTPKYAATGIGSTGVQDDGGFFQNLLSGPVGKVLSTIDLGRSALVSTIKEGIDLVQGEGFSGSDWLEQTKNHYGFGTLLKDENIDLGLGGWGNRIVGFVGDVALDPVTYMTLGTGALAKQGTKEIADQLMKAGFKNEATRVVKTGSKLAAGGKALRQIGYDVGFGFNVPGTGQIGRALRFDKALDAVTRGAVSRRRAREWAPFFRQQMKSLGSKKSDEAIDVLFEDAVRKGRNSAREIIEAEARDLVSDRAGMAAGLADEPAGFAVGRTGEAVPMGDFAEDVLDEISDDLLGTVTKASRSRSDIVWRNGKAAYQSFDEAGRIIDPVSRRIGGGDNAIITTIASKPGEAFQRVLRSTMGQRLSKGLRRKAELDKYLMSGNPILYGMAREIETGDVIGFANKGKWLQTVDQLQHEMLTAAHKGGFDVADIGPGAVGEYVGAGATAAQSARAASSRLLYDAMDEPWQYMDEAGQLVDNRNLDEFRDFVSKYGDGSMSAEEIHRSMRKFWDDVGEDWARVSGRDIRDPVFMDEFSNEVFTTRRMSGVAREAARSEGWYQRMNKQGSRLGERPDPNDLDVPKSPKGVRDVSYMIKERVFKPGFRFTWKGEAFTIAKPGTIVDGVQAPSVRKQIENFVAKVDPKFQDEAVNFFDSDVAKVIDGYKSSAGRELIWAAMEERLIAKGILVSGEDIAAYNRLMREMSDNVKTVRKNQQKLTNEAARKRAKAEEAAASAKSSLDEGERLSAEAADAQRQLDALDPQVAAIQRTLVNMMEEMEESIARTAGGTSKTGRESVDAMEDLFAMAMGLEASTRLAQMLRTIAQGITTKGQLPARVNRSFQDILTQLKIAKDMLEVVKNQAAKLGGQDKAVREIEQLIDGLMGKSRMGMARKDAPKYIQNFVEQVHEVGRLADELDAPVIFNAGYRRPTNVFDIANRKWVKETEQRIRAQLDADVGASAQGRKLQTEGSIFQSFADEGGNPLYGKVISKEADRITLMEKGRELNDRVIELNQKAQNAKLKAQRLQGYGGEQSFPRNYGVPPSRSPKSVLDWEAEALDLESQAAALNSKIIQADEATEVLEQDMNKFYDAENIFESLTNKQQWGNDDPIGALMAGIEDGMLPFGPVYAMPALGRTATVAQDVVTRPGSGQRGTQLFESAVVNPNEEVLAAMRSMMNVGEQELTGLFKVWDSLTGYFKAQAIARPSFIQRNGLGALFMNMLAGADMGNHIKFMSMREKAIKAGWKDALAEAGEVYKGVKNQEGLRQFYRTRPLGLKQRAAVIGAQKLVKQGNREFRDLIRVYESGAIGAGQAASEVAQSYRMSGATTLDQYGRPRRWNPLRRDNVYNTAIRSGNAEMEEFVRGSLAYDSIVNGMDEAATISRVNQFHFNYSKENMSDFERQWMARAYPFYTWMRNSIPLMATQLARNPRPFLRYLTMKRNLEMGVEKDKNIASWYGKRWGIDLGALMGNPNQGARSFAFPDLPFMDLVEATQDPLRVATGGLNPLIKTPIELFTGINTFSQVPIKDQYIKPPGMFQRIPGFLAFLEKTPFVKKNSKGVYGMKESTVYALGNYIPYLGMLRRLDPQEKKYSDKQFSAFLGAILPIGYRDSKTVARERQGQYVSDIMSVSEDRNISKSLEMLR